MPRQTDEERADAQEKLKRGVIQRIHKAEANGNGHRPRLSPKQIAVRMGERSLPKLMRYLIEVANGLHPDASHDQRLKAAAMIAAKCGLPDRTESAVPPAMQSKAFEIRGWRDASGTFHEASKDELQVMAMVLKGGVGIGFAGILRPGIRVTAQGVRAGESGAVPDDGEPGAADLVDERVREGEDAGDP